MQVVKKAQLPHGLASVLLKYGLVWFSAFLTVEPFIVSKRDNMIYLPFALDHGGTRSMSIYCKLARLLFLFYS